MHKDISRKDKKILSSHSDIAYDSPDVVEGSPKLRAEEVEEVPGNVQFYLKQYESILDATEKMTSVVDDRCSGYTFVFDPIERPDLASAVKKVFGTSTNKITYDMYREVIEEQIKLNNEIGDEIFGQ